MLDVLKIWYTENRRSLFAALHSAAHNTLMFYVP